MPHLGGEWFMVSPHETTKMALHLLMRWVILRGYSALGIAVPAHCLPTP